MQQNAQNFQMMMMIGKTNSLVNSLPQIIDEPGVTINHGPITFIMSPVQERKEDGSGDTDKLT